MSGLPHFLELATKIEAFHYGLSIGLKSFERVVSKEVGCYYYIQGDHIPLSVVDALASTIYSYQWIDELSENGYFMFLLIREILSASAPPYL